MTFNQIAALRFQNQHISDNRFTQAKDVVDWLGAVQAQDYNMAKWALGVRLPGTTNEIIEQAIDKGEIIRTHVLRPTWHFVTPSDLRWMMGLTAANINRLMGTNNRKLELDDKTFKKTNGLIEKILGHAKSATRKEIMSVLEKKGIQTNDLRASHIMLRAETDMIVCNGPMHGKLFTYALFDEKVPAKKITKEEALALLARKYFQSHGPATLQDFTWWSGLSVSDSKIGFENTRMEMQKEIVKGHSFWLYPSEHVKPYNKMVFLPAYDEFLISYKSREIGLPVEFASKTFTTNGIFNPIMVHKAKVKGLWKPRYQKGFTIERIFFERVSETEIRLSKKAANEFAKFINKKLDQLK